MARPRFTGQGFTNPLDSLGFNAESRHRAMPPLSNAFMSNETHLAENAKGNQVFNVPLLGRAVSGVGKLFGRGGAKAGAGELAETGAKRGFGRIFGRRGAGEATEELTEEQLEKQAQKEFLQNWQQTQLQNSIRATPSPVRAQLIKTGGLVIVGGFGLWQAFGLGEDIVDNLTGENCDEKAIAAGYEEGSEDFKNYVENCQEDSLNKVAMLGVATIGIVGLLAVFLLRPKGSGDDDGDDE